MEKINQIERFNRNPPFGSWDGGGGGGGNLNDASKIENSPYWQMKRLFCITSPPLNQRIDLGDGLYFEMHEDTDIEDEPDANNIDDGLPIVKFCQWLNRLVGTAACPNHNFRQSL